MSAWVDDVARTLQAAVPASGLHKVSLSTKASEVRIEPSSDNAIHISVTLKPKKGSFGFAQSVDGKEAVAKARLNKTVNDGALKLSVLSPQAEDDQDDGFQEKWHVQMPTALALYTDVKTGKIRISGIAGGVTAEMTAGDVRIHVPEGSVTARVKVGTLEVTTDAPAYKTLTLDSSIGGVNIRGIDLSAKRGHSAMGKHVSLQGHGTDDFDLSTNMGKVTLNFAQP